MSLNNAPMIERLLFGCVVFCVSCSWCCQLRRL